MHLGGCQTIYHFNKVEAVPGPPTTLPPPSKAKSSQNRSVGPACVNNTPTSELISHGPTTHFYCLMSVI